MFLVISTALVLHGVIIEDLGPINFSDISFNSIKSDSRTQESFFISSNDNSSETLTTKTFNFGSPKNNIITEY